MANDNDTTTTTTTHTIVHTIHVGRPLPGGEWHAILDGDETTGGSGSTPTLAVVALLLDLARGIIQGDVTMEEVATLPEA